MPYDYKKKQACKQKSGKKGNYVSKKTGAAHQKCWKSKEAFEKSQAAAHSFDESLLRSMVRNILLEEHSEGMLEIMPSEIAGMGVFATTEIPAGTDLGTVHIKKPNGKYHVTELGHFHNHSYEPNCVNIMKDGKRNLFADRSIFPNEEITVDYTKQPDLEQPKAGWK